MKDKIFFAKNKQSKKVNNRRGRLIIRNLPFTVSFDVKKYFYFQYFKNYNMLIYKLFVLKVYILLYHYQTNEVQLQEHFSKFGEINEIKLLRKPDGKLIGCGFVQFVVKQNAAKAIAHTSGKDFLGKY